MEYLKKIHEPVIPKKRPLDVSNDHEVKEFRKSKTMVNEHSSPKSRTGMQIVCDPRESRTNNPFGSRPTGKVKFWDPTCDAQETKVTTSGISQSKTLKSLDIVDSNLGKMISHGEDKLVESKAIENNKLKSIRPKESFVSRPVGKVKFWDPTCDARKSKVTTSVISWSKTLKSLDIVDSNLGNMVSHDENKLVEWKAIENNKLKNIKPKESYVSRPVGKVKFWDPRTCDAQKSKDIVVSPMEQVRREKIKEAMAMFDEVYKQSFQDNKLKLKEEKIAHWRVPIEVAKLVKQKLKWTDTKKILGPICGVQIGDKFKFRSQLEMTGLHCQLQSGIDYAMIKGKNLAISIVNSHRYSNESGSCDTLIYYGQGGLGFFGSKLPPEDQKLERGNLALKNSMDEKTPVRVIQKVDDVFVYDGLYIVKHYTKERSAQGKMIFKFKLNRVPGQPPLSS